MATEAVTTTVSSPRIDRKFVDAQGNLTQNAYALLYGLIVRTGGTTAPVIDTAGLSQRLDATESEIDSLSHEPAPAPVLAQEDPRDAVIQSLAADMARLTQRIEQLEQEPK